MSEATDSSPTTTALERIWNRPQGHLFKSERHRVMAFADDFPKMPLQVVVAPASGKPGEEVHFYDLELRQQRVLLEVGIAIGTKILANCMPGQRSMATLEGFAVKDHAHIVYYAGERGEAINRYTGIMLGQAAVNQTIELVTFSPSEAHLLETRLDHIHQ